MVFREIDISIATINGKPQNQLNLNFMRILRFDTDKLIPIAKTMLYCKSNVQKKKKKKKSICLISNKSQNVSNRAFFCIIMVNGLEGRHCVEKMTSN